MDKKGDISGSASHTSELFFKNLGHTLPTKQHSVTSMEEIYQITCSFLWSHEGFNSIHLTYSTAQDL